MAKRQRTMKDMLLRNERNLEICPTTVTSSSQSVNKELNQVEAARLAWKDAWYV